MAGIATQNQVNGIAGRPGRAADGGASPVSTPYTGTFSDSRAAFRTNSSGPEKSKEL